MIVAPHIVEVSVVDSPNIDGIKYEMVTTIVPEACGNCGATGIVRFYTHADRLANEQWECDCMEECDCEPLDRMTGERVCERCGGSGTKTGDGILMTAKLRLPLYFKATVA